MSAISATHNETNICDDYRIKVWSGFEGGLFQAFTYVLVYRDYPNQTDETLVPKWSDYPVHIVMEKEGVELCQVIWEQL